MEASSASAEKKKRGVCEAFFQDPLSLQEWSNQQLLAPIVTFIEDDHSGIWGIINNFALPVITVRREVLDWFHLTENLYKVGGSLRRLEAVENLLWHGFVDSAIAAFEGPKNRKAKNFIAYLTRHRERIPDYCQYQKLGISI